MPGSRSNSRGGRVNLSPERAAEYDRVLMAWNLGQVKAESHPFKWVIDGQDVTSMIFTLVGEGRIASNPLPKVTSYGDP
jgi:hypothetical protein